MKILVLGSNGLLGRAVRKAGIEGASFSTRADADLTQLSEVESLFKRFTPDLVLNLAGHVGGIGQNSTKPFSFLASNLSIETNLAIAAASVDCDIIRIGSNAMYSPLAQIPLREDDLFVGELELHTNAYGLAKRVAGQLSISSNKERGSNNRMLILSNIYGPGDNMRLERAHLPAAALIKVHASRPQIPVEIWGTGKARREFTYVDDIANWIVSEIYDYKSWPHFLNLGSSEEASVKTFYEIARDVVKKDCTFSYLLEKPEGPASKLLDSSLARKEHNWSPSTKLISGMEKLYSEWITGNDSI